MAKHVFTIVCEWDEQAHVWYVAESNVPGLSAEAPTCDAMRKLLPELVRELVQLNMPELLNHSSERAPLELIVQSREKLQLNC